MDDPVNRVDASGLDWRVDRRRGVQAPADCCNDTVQALATKIGLDAHYYRKWLTPRDGLPLPATETEVMGSRKFLIPNTVVAYWAGWDKLGLGKDAVAWDSSVSYLSDLGFDVVQYDHIPGQRLVLQKILVNKANAKLLHGLYFWGHGSKPYPADRLISHEALTPRGDTVLIFFETTKQLPYLLALALVYACDSNSGQANLSSGAPGAIWWGYTGTLYPLGGAAYYHVRRHIGHGDQETK